MSERPFDAMRRALHDISHESNQQASTQDLRPTRLDPHRQARTGIPEIIYGRTKTADEVVTSLAALARQNGRAMATRCPEATLAAVATSLSAEFDVSVEIEASAVVVARHGSVPPRTGGCVAVITAGSSDAPVAAETAFVAREMGVEVHEVRDVGVAGLHRLVEPLERVIAAGVDAIVVVAGMDGALPSVVAGLVAVPVIGVPVSTGYGFGGEGTAALGTMLQSCAPGLVVVNIDNGVGAGATAALIANRVAAARARSAQPG
jgi:NCAIR mutase (PurE)-related protein